MARERRACVLLFGLASTAVGCARPRTASNDLAPKPAQQQVVYDWREASLKSSDQLTAGNRVRFSIVSLNPVCYEYTTSIRQVAAESNTKPFTDLLGPKLTTTETPEPPEPATAATTPQTFPAPASPRTGARSIQTNEAVAHFKRIVDLVALTNSELKRVERDMNAQVERRNGASKALEVFYNIACPRGGRGPSNIAALWTSAASAIDTFLNKADSVNAALAALKLVTNTRAKAAAELAAFHARKEEAGYAAWLKASNNASQLDTFGSAIQKYELTIGLLGETGAAIKASTATLKDAKTDVEAHSGPVTRHRSDFVKKNSETFQATISATGRPTVPTVKGQSFADTITLDVHRRNRIFTTAGFVLSNLEEHHYRRGNVPSGDSSLSTFIDARENDRIAFSPSVFAHVTLGERGGIALAATAGIGARSVSARIAPDFLMGASLTVSDAAVLTVGLHRGRIETLLIPDDLKGKAVAASVTTEDAVGEKWGNAFAVAFSLKLP